jgi:hypothetical protein
MSVGGERGFAEDYLISAEVGRGECADQQCQL